MKIKNRQLIHMPIEKYQEWKRISKDFNIKQVDLMSRALQLIKQELYEKNPHTILLKDLIQKFYKIISDNSTQIEKLTKKIDDLINSKK